MMSITISLSKESVSVLMAETDIGGAVTSEKRLMTELDPQQLNSIMLLGV